MADNPDSPTAQSASGADDRTEFVSIDLACEDEPTYTVETYGTIVSSLE